MSTSTQENKKVGHHLTSGFRNDPPVPEASSKGICFFLRRLLGSLFLPDVASEHSIKEEMALERYKKFDGDHSISWLGQATLLLTLDGKNILTDPYLTEYASPSTRGGPRRFVPPGISINNLPPIDIVLVSHNHYDHLDADTVESLKGKENIQVIVPLGLKEFFIERGYKQVIELDWEESFEFQGLRFTSLPAVHDSRRWVDDKNKTLWCSWSISGSMGKYYFAGDTAYSPTIFSEIGKNHGPFALAMLPIGAYEPRKLMWMSHATPEEAVKIGTEIRAEVLLAMHWGTIELSDEPHREPPIRFKEAGQLENISQENIWIMKIGESRRLPSLLLKDNN